MLIRAVQFENVTIYKNMQERLEFKQGLIWTILNDFGQSGTSVRSKAKLRYANMARDSDFFER